LVKKCSWLPYSSEDLTMDACKLIARDLRALKEYQKVKIRKKRPEYMYRKGKRTLVPFGRVYVCR